MLRVERAALHGSGLMGNPDRDMDESLKRQEREAIEAALRISGARVCGPRGAARDLGCRPRLDLRIKRLGIDKLQYRSIQKQSARLRFRSAATPSAVFPAIAWLVFFAVILMAALGFVRLPNNAV